MPLSTTLGALSHEVHEKHRHYQLGHKKLSTTLNVYSHVVSGAQERAASMLPDLNGDDEN